MFSRNAFHKNVVLIPNYILHVPLIRGAQKSGVFMFGSTVRFLTRNDWDIFYQINIKLIFILADYSYYQRGYQTDC